MSDDFVEKSFPDSSSSKLCKAPAGDSPTPKAPKMICPFRLPKRAMEVPKPALAIRLPPIGSLLLHDSGSLLILLHARVVGSIAAIKMAPVTTLVFGLVAAGTPIAIIRSLVVAIVSNISIDSPNRLALKPERMLEFNVSIVDAAITEIVFDSLRKVIAHNFLAAFELVTMIAVFCVLEKD